MIKSLHITNYALIDEIDIDFAQGFNIITGETGAGKSIILGALSLLLGGRADTKAVRRGERKSVIEGSLLAQRRLGGGGTHRAQRPRQHHARRMPAAA